MPTPLLSRRDIDFLIFDWLRIDDLFARERFAEHSRETVTAVIDLAERLTEAEFLPHYKDADRDEPKLRADGVEVHPAVRAAVRAFSEAGLAAGPFDASLGGLQLPELVHTAVMAYSMAANVATTAYPMLSIGNSRLLSTFGTPAQIEAFVRPQVEGRALGTMCLSEPQAGSSLADIATRAEADGEGALGRRYRITGNKMWISGGDHDITDNIVHLVLAKIVGDDGKLPSGTAGISLFAVPKLLVEDGSAERNDISVAGLNHKMGYRGTANCLLNFGEGVRHRPGGRAGAVGYLVGEPGRGLAAMFHMMNEARIAIGLGAAALGYRAHRLSVDYARERRQGRPAGARAGSPVAIIDHPDVRRMLLAQKTYSEGALALVFYCARLIDEARTATDENTRAQALSCLEILTPVAKAWPSEWGLAANDLAIQIHGGYGYTRDFDVEQLYRDNRLNPIHEGTTGIQAIDLVGRKIRRSGDGALKLLSERVEATCRKAAAAGLSTQAQALTHDWVRIGDIAEDLLQRDHQVAIWNATHFLSAFGHAVVAWLWLDQAATLEPDADDLATARFAQAKRRCCRFFFETEVPKIATWLQLVADNSDVAAACPPEFFINE